MGQYPLFDGKRLTISAESHDRTRRGVDFYLDGDVVLTGQGPLQTWATVEELDKVKQALAKLGVPEPASIESTLVQYQTLAEVVRDGEELPKIDRTVFCEVLRILLADITWEPYESGNRREMIVPGSKRAAELLIDENFSPSESKGFPECIRLTLEVWIARRREGTRSYMGSFVTNPNPGLRYKKFKDDGPF